MSKSMFNYSKKILETVSFDSNLFCRELEKAVKILLPYEIEQLTIWLISFIKEKPELQQCMIFVNK
jgi:DNA replication protein DnaD